MASLEELQRTYGWITTIDNEVSTPTERGEQVLREIDGVEHLTAREQVELLATLALALMYEGARGSMGPSATEQQRGQVDPLTFRQEMADEVFDWLVDGKKSEGIRLRLTPKGLIFQVKHVTGAPLPGDLLTEDGYLSVGIASWDSLALDATALLGERKSD